MKNNFNYFPLKVSNKILKNINLQSYSYYREFHTNKFDTTGEIYSDLISFILLNEMNIPYNGHVIFVNIFKNISRMIKDNLNINPFNYNLKFKFKSHNINNQIEQLINYLFYKYKVPKWIYHIYTTEYNSINYPNILYKSIQIGNGQSTRSVFNLSKNENKYFYESKFPLYNESNFKYYLTCRAKGCNTLLSHILALRLRDKGFYNIGEKFQDSINKSNIFIEWISKQPMFSYDIIDELLDFYVNHLDINLKSRTVDSLYNLAIKWHEQLSKEKDIRVIKWDLHDLSWIETSTNELQSSDLIIAEELNTLSLLRKEGNRQHNCVSSYSRQCSNNATSIVSLITPKKERITLEIRLENRQIVQAKEICNRKVSNENKNYITKYADAKNLTINFY